MSFLSALLPTVLGAGLAATGVGAPLAALIVGGGYAAANGGNLRKGLMAGLGAYGGAGLAGSFGTAGASSVTSSVTPPVTPPPAPVIPEGVTNFGPSASTDAFSMTPTTPAITPSASLPQGLQDYGPVGQYTGSSAPLPTSTGGMDVAGAQPPTQGIPNAAPVSEQASVRAIDNATIPKDFNAMNASERASAIGRGASFDNAGSFISAHPYQAAGIGLSVASGMEKTPTLTPPDKDMGQRYSYNIGAANPQPQPDVPSYDDMLHKQGNFGKMQSYYPGQGYTPISNTAAYDLYHYGTKAATGGLMNLYAGGGPVEQMSNQNAIGANTGFPQAYLHTSAYSSPTQTPISQNVLTGPGDVGVDPYTGEQNMAAGGVAKYGLGGLNIDPNMQTSDGGTIGEMLHQMVSGKNSQRQASPKYTYNPDDQQYVQQQATGGLSDAHYNLGGYSDGGRLLRGPGDGVSDSIPATIGKRQPARLADGEFVVPARIVSELGNGSTEAGARKLYAMMDRIQSSRKKSIGKGRVAFNNKADRHLPA
jgi:hypothetical protein